MTPVERMARAIAAVEGWEMPQDMTLPYAPGSRIGMAMQKARAALEEAREPSEAMIEAGKIPTRQIDLGNGTTATGLGLGASPEAIFKAMIDKALSET